MSAPTYCWSSDEERFQGDFATREEALAEAAAEGLYDREPGETATVWTGEIRHALSFLRKRERWIGENVIEQLDEWLCDDIASDDRIIDLPQDRQEELGKLILDFLEQHAGFTSWAVEEIQTHEVEVPKEGEA